MGEGSVKYFSGLSILLLLCVSGCFTPAPPVPEVRPLPAGQDDEFSQSRRHIFDFYGARAWVAEPNNPAKGKPWCWYFADEADVTAEVAVAQLLERGVYCVFVKALPAERQAEFYHLMRETGLGERVILAGIGAGADAAYRFAARNPAHVALLYGDSPDCRFLNDDPEILPTLVKNKVPILHVIGTADEVTPPATNSDRVEVVVRQLGGKIEVIRKNGVGHRPYGLANSGALARYILKNRR